MMTKLSKAYKRKFVELRAVINAWELIPDAPEDEFDAIDHLLLSQLYKGSDAFKIAKALKFELNHNYGFSVADDAVANMVTEVIAWWNSLKE
ncbi:MAG: hypothetical protein AAF611_04415 [Bacteroidota bacterium]